LKPSNILLDDLGYPLIGDFGTSRYESDDATFTGETGTVYYAAPEMFKEVIPTTKVDIFSFGLVLYEILVGSPVFPLSMAARPVMKCILNSDMPKIPSTCGEMMQKLIKRCWSMNPGDRPSFDDIFAEFQANNFDIVPGANAITIRDYARGILAWEARRDSAQRKRKVGEASDE
jgi:serine/threonine protein kinase